MRRTTETGRSPIEEPLEGERAALATDYLAAKLELNVLDAESDVLASEALGVTDVIAMRRLDRARGELRNLLAQRQRARALSTAALPIEGDAA